MKKFIIKDNIDISVADIIFLLFFFYALIMHSQATTEWFADSALTMSKADLMLIIVFICRVK